MLMEIAAGLSSALSKGWSSRLHLPIQPSPEPQDRGDFCILISQMGNLRRSKVKDLTPSHPAGKWCVGIQTRIWATPRPSSPTAPHSCGSERGFQHPRSPGERSQGQHAPSLGKGAPQHGALPSPPASLLLEPASSLFSVVRLSRRLYFTFKSRLLTLPLPLSVNFLRFTDGDPYQFPGAAITKHHKPGGLKQQKFVLSHLKDRRPGSRCWQARALWQARGLFRTFL